MNDIKLTEEEIECLYDIKSKIDKCKRRRLCYQVDYYEDGKINTDKMPKNVYENWVSIDNLLTSVDNILGFNE